MLAIGGFISVISSYIYKWQAGFAFIMVIICTKVYGIYLMVRKFS